jgi:hypothetical protein
MPAPNKPQQFFSSVKAARQVLRDKAQELLDEYRAMIKLAAASGKFDEALKAQQWLLDHIPADEGERVFDPSTDRPAPAEAQSSGPTIQIVGLALSPQHPALPEPAVDASLIHDPDPA